MPERSSISQVVQIGVESTPGTAVAASKRLSSLGIEMSPNIETQQFRPSGSKYNTLSILGKEWMEGSLSGNAVYDEIIYPLSSCLTAATVTTPGGGTNSRLWTFKPSVTTEDNPKTFTVEQGSSFRGQRFAYGIVNELGLSINRDAIEVSGNVLGQAIQEPVNLTGSTITAGITNASAAVTYTGMLGTGDVGKTVSGTGITGGTTIIAVNPGVGFTLSANATATNPTATLTLGTATTQLPLVPILPSTVCAYLDSTAGAIGTTKLTRVLGLEWGLSDRFGPLWTVDCGVSSFATHIETEPSLTCTLTLEADAAGMSFLTQVRAGSTKFLRILATGSIIEGALPYYFQIDMPIKVVDTGGFSDEDGVYAVEWSCVGVQDSTFDGGTGGAVKVLVQNTTTAL